MLKRRGRAEDGAERTRGIDRTMDDWRSPEVNELIGAILRLDDADLVFEQHDRSLVARVRNFDLDILFVRTNDVIEFVGDGVADLGVTGDDLLAETGAELPRLRSLGYGQCRLTAAVPADSALRD